MGANPVFESSTIDKEIQYTPLNWFEQLVGIYKEASTSGGGVIDCFFQLDHLSINVRFAGEAMVPWIWPALEHLATEPVDKPDLTVLIWDSLSTGTTMPPPPWTSNAYGRRGHINGFNDGRIFTNVDAGLSLLRMLDAERNIGLFWCHDISRIPQYETGAPLRTILSWWMGPQGYQLSHGAAVGTADGGVLLAGKGGSGKSTTALLCLRSELKYAGDDFCVISNEPQPFVYSLYNSAKINHDNLHRIPTNLLAKVAELDWYENEKALLFMQQAYPEKLLAGFPIRAIIVPHIGTSNDTSFRRASPATALRALAPSSLFLRPDSGAQAFHAMANLVRKVPAYQLELGNDLEQIPEVVTSLLAKETT